MAKTYEVKIYDQAGSAYKGTYKIMSTPHFNANVNGGLGELTIQLPYTLKDFSLGVELNYTNQVQLWVRDIDTGNDGVLVYSGYMVDFYPTISGNKEFVEVKIWGNATRLARTFYRNGFTVGFDLTDDPADIVKDIVDKYRALVDNPIVNYDGTSVSSLGSNLNIVFKMKKCSEAIDMVREATGEGWFWYVGADNILHFTTKPSTPTHTFVYGKDFSDIKFGFESSKVRNGMILYNGMQDDDASKIAYLFYNATSQGSYFNSEEYLQESGIEEDDTAISFGEAYINSKKNPNQFVEVKLKDNNFGKGYDIESVKCGDTFKILNIPSDVNFSGNIMVTGVEYTPTQMTVYGEDLEAMTSRVLRTLERSIRGSQVEDAVDTVTGSAVS